MIDDPARPTITPDMLAPRRERRDDFERGLSYLPPLTLAILAVLGAVFAWQIHAGALDSLEAIVAAGALDHERTWSGEWWRLGSATVLHGSLEHLLGNAALFYCVGIALEHAIGAGPMLGVYVTAALGGSLASLLWGAEPSVGASGAIFGVTAAAAVALFRRRDTMVVRERRIPFVVGFLAALQIGLGFLSPLVDNFAHLGGAVAGIVGVLLLDPMRRA